MPPLTRLPPLLSLSLSRARHSLVVSPSSWSLLHFSGASRSFAFAAKRPSPSRRSKPSPPSSLLLPLSPSCQNVLRVLSTHTTDLSLQQLERYIRQVLREIDGEESGADEENVSRVPLFVRHESPKLDVRDAQQVYVMLLQSMTRREILLSEKELYAYQRKAQEEPLSPLHPSYYEWRVSSRLSDHGRVLMRRGFVLLSIAIEVDMCMQRMNTIQSITTSDVVSAGTRQNAEAILTGAGHHYMSMRVHKNEVSRACDSGTSTRQHEHLQIDKVAIEKRFPYHFYALDALECPSSQDIAMYAEELEILTSGSMPVYEQLYVLKQSAERLAAITAEEITGLKSVLPLVSAKLEIHRESEKDRIVRWRVMTLTDKIMVTMDENDVTWNQKLIDEIFRTYANCSAISHLFQLVDDLKQGKFGPFQPDLMIYRLILRGVSIAQRWEQPHVCADRVLAMMQSDGFESDISVFNDLLRAYDRAERPDLIGQVVADMRARNIEPNETTIHYVSQSFVDAGEPETALLTLLPEARDREEFAKEALDLEHTAQQKMQSKPVQSVSPA